MSKLLETTAKVVEKIADFSAGAVSCFLVYQPKTPACLLEDEE